MCDDDAEQSQFISMLHDSVVMLCRSGIANFSSVLRVDGLIGVTLRDRQVVLVNIHEEFSVDCSRGKSTVDSDETGSESLRTNKRNAMQRIKECQQSESVEEHRFSDWPDESWSRRHVVTDTNGGNISKEFNGVKELVIGKQHHNVYSSPSETQTNAESADFAYGHHQYVKLKPQLYRGDNVQGNRSYDVDYIKHEPDDSVYLSSEESCVDESQFQTDGMTYPQLAYHQQCPPLPYSRSSTTLIESTDFEGDRQQAVEPGSSILSDSCLSLQVSGPSPRSIPSRRRLYSCNLCCYRSNRSFDFLRHFVQRHSYNDCVECPDCRAVVHVNAFSKHWLRYHSAMITRNIRSIRAAPYSSTDAVQYQAHVEAESADFGPKSDVNRNSVDVKSELSVTASDLQIKHSDVT